MGDVRYLLFATKRKFGVEIEVTNHLAKAKLAEFVKAVDPGRECKVSNANDKDYGNNYWKIKHDGSIKDNEFNAGSELSSFVASGVNDIALIGKVVGKFRDEGVKVNDKCAVHVHAEVADFNKQQLAKVVAYWMKIEPVLLQAVPKRRRTSEYCVPLRQFFKAMKLDNLSYHAVEFWRKVCPPYHDDKHRRVTFNICNVCSAWRPNYDYDEYYPPGEVKQRKTVELRLPEGSVDPHDVMNWIKFFVRFVNLGKNKTSPSDLSVMGLKDTLRFLGLHGTDDSPVILSKGLWGLKAWLLERLLEHSDDGDLVDEALALLNYMSAPYRVYAEKESNNGNGKKTPKKAEQSRKYGVQDWLVPM